MSRPETSCAAKGALNVSRASANSMKGLFDALRTGVSMNGDGRRSYRFGVDAEQATLWLMVAIACSLNAAWLTAVVVAIVAGDGAMALIHLVIPPFGIIRGVGIWFGVA